MKVHVQVEGKRGCGYRKSGSDGYGMYLMGPAFAEPCERLSFPLCVCPTCGAGIKFSRGFTWVNPIELFAPDLAPICTPNEVPDHNHDKCPMCSPWTAGDQAGLMWVGKRYYSVEAFITEARRMGISKRVSNLPQGFELGTHFIYLAHIRACVPEPQMGTDVDEEASPGIFWVFKPSHVELVIDDENDVPQAALDAAERIGEERVRIVKVIREGEMERMPL